MICCFTIKSFMNMSLPTAGMVIGWISTIINILQCGILTRADDIRGFAKTRVGSFPDHVEYGFSVGSSVIFTITFLDLIASILLIVGVNKKKHLFILPWLINNGIFLFFKIFIGIVLIAIVSSYGDSNPDFPQGFLIVLILSILVFLCMVWNAVYSLFQSIRKSNEQAVDEERLVEDTKPGFTYELFKNPV